MRIVILHQAIPANAAPDEQDVLQQAAAVGQALLRLGHTIEIRPCSLDLAALDAALKASAPDLVFNLVESLSGAGRLIHLPPALLDTRACAYTGCSAEALFLTSHKILAKERLRAADLPTPMWLSTDSMRTDAPGHPDNAKEEHPRTWLTKSIWEHASLGMDDTCLLRAATPSMAARHLATFAARMGGACFAEEYIDGREFNIGLLDSPNGPEVLPPAEIVFTDFPADKPRIVGYQAKWDTESFEYQHTTRQFSEAAADQTLLKSMKQLALRCWDVFDLAGYARVDFRVDADGTPWILEVNSNPCISPDAGFAAMIQQAGLTFDQAVDRIVQAALSRKARIQPAAVLPLLAPSAPARNITGSNTAVPSPYSFRQELRESDRSAIRELAQATGFFHADEVEIAVELVDERLNKGAASGYEFLLAEQDGRVAGYTCFGPIPCTATSYDLYWIAVHPDQQGQGLGRLLNLETERRIRELGGTRVYAETSSRPQYLSTRTFYERTGYKLAEMLEDFYAPGDGRATYLKIL